MLYYFFRWLDKTYDLPGAGVVEYISFRASMSIVFSLLISMFLGKYFITLLKKKQVDETVRDLGLQGQKEKEGTPTMGGLIIITAIFLPTVLFAKLNNIYILLILITTLWMGIFGFMDDYIKVFKKNKQGLKGIFKILGQFSIGLVIGLFMLYHGNIVIRNTGHLPLKGNILSYDKTEVLANGSDTKANLTTIPFLKGNEFDYATPLKIFGIGSEKWVFIIFLPVVIFIVSAVSNGLNITDGLDGLAAGTTAIIGAALGVLTYVSGNAIYSNYLNIMYLPGVGELTVYCSAFVGACVGFLWYNSYPAQVFMGDTGSLSLGAAVAVLAIMIRKELLLPVLCGVFLIENLSVILQVSYFKYTKKRFGTGKRIFKMSPLHHHYQLTGFHESKIVTRFWIVSIILAILAIVTLKLR
ncbi:MAG: phospho-N-acetylmuramoyl-pentapeptide-transferase [Bacteroidetes bacterium RIFCSPLOWO2_02_FULL_36_8]|nr:MAG: phospho-N-acetylmuramoyl-pentapeptide-transferase [Bacteroidetes bacterium RIFCSPLOWO2_02_FULL_36_8]OFY70114.1 MAG: phospho-N-acetylmuramoyl-pentapeptide-transferase [Bacteroidetes bacterium RIFCSPLOWO2_12_FULL_37_12]